MKNLKLVIEYDGTDFVGWQSQINGRSVQDEISAVLARVLQEPITLQGSGRTDAGVHSRGQVANFRTSTTLSVAQILHALNGLLREDVVIRSVEEVPDEFHARYSAQERAYRYFICIHPTAIDRHYAWFVKFDLDVQKMNVAAREILGEHDFESFCKSDSEVDHHRCTVTLSEWKKERDGLIYDIRANRFLHGMVRALVGTMVDIGRGFIPADAMQEILAAKDRGKAGMAAPPQGLFLEEVVY